MGSIPTGQDQQANYGDALQKLSDSIQSNAGADTGGQQQKLAAALQQQAAGGGPNLAGEQLKAGLAQANAQQAGALTSARGGDLGTSRRLIAQNAAQSQEGASGQAAQLRMQQQLAAQQQLGGLLSAQRGQDIYQQAANTQGAGTLGQLRQGQNQLSQQGQEFNQNLNAQLGTAGVGAGASFLSPLFSAKGGEVPSYADGGGVDMEMSSLPLSMPNVGALRAGSSGHGGLGKMLQGLFSKGSSTGTADKIGAEQSGAGDMGGAGLDAGGSGLPVVGGATGAGAEIGGGTAAAEGAGGAGLLAALAAHGGQIERSRKLASLLSNDAPMPTGYARMAGGGMSRGQPDRRVPPTVQATGGRIGGAPKVRRNDYVNDTVPAMLTPKEIVLPLSVTLSKDAPERAAEFVRAIKMHGRPPAKRATR